MTVTGKAPTSSSVALTIKEGNGGKTSTVSITTIAHYSITSGSTTTYYNTIEQAISAATTGQTITQIADYEDSSLATIDGKNITFNSNGKTLTKTSNGFIVNSNATLEVTGSGTITTPDAFDLFTSSGTLNISHTGTLSQTCSNPVDKRVIRTSAGELNITQNTNIKAYAWMVGINGTTDANISSGTISSYGDGYTGGYSIGVTDTANATIGAANISNTNNCAVVYMVSTGTVTMNNTTVQSIGTAIEKYGIPLRVENNGKMIINGGTYSCTNGVYSACCVGGTLTVNSGTISSDARGIVGYDSSTININGGSVTTTGTTYCIEALSGTALNVSGTANISSTTASGVCIGNENGSTSGTFNMTGGTISAGRSDGLRLFGGSTGTVTGGTIATSADSGVYVAKGTLNVGNPSATLSTSVPCISGTNGVWKNAGDTANANWIFYNGILKGTSTAYNLLPSAVRTDHSIATGTSGNYKTAYLSTTKNYEISSGVPKYHITLASAITACPAGQTIKVLADTSETGTLTVSKNLTINTNGKTLTRTSGIIYVTAGTLTVSGNGGINVTAADTLGIFLTGTGAFKTADKPLLQATNSIIYTESSGAINMAGGYLYSRGRSCIYVEGTSTSNVTLTNTYAYCPYIDKGAVFFDSGTTGTLTINGASRIGNASTNTSGTAGGGNSAPTIGYYSTGKLSVAGTAWIMGGPYADHTIRLQVACSLEFTDESRVYATNTTTGRYCVFVPVNNCKVTFNSQGYFYASGSYVANLASTNTTLTVTAGHFVSGDHKYMFYKNGAAVTTDVSTATSATAKTYYYMNAYNGTTSKSINGFGYNKGIK